MGHKSSFPTFALALLAAALPTAHAASANWSGGGTDALWTSTANWSATPVPGSADTATFVGAAGAGGKIIDLGSGVTVNTINFVGPSFAAYTIGAGAVNSQTLVLNGSGNAGFAANIGTASTSQITVNAALTVKNTQQWYCTLGANPWVINGNVNANGVSGSSIQVKINGKNFTFNGLLADQVGGAKLQISGANGQTATLTNPNNSFTGGLDFDNGTVSVNTISMTGSPSAAGAGGTLNMGSGFGGGQFTYTGTGNTTDRIINLAASISNTSTIAQSGTGLMKFTANMTFTGVAGKTIALRGATAGSGEFAGAIGDAPSSSTTTTATGGAAAGATTIIVTDRRLTPVGSLVSGTGIAAGTYVTANVVVSGNIGTLTLSTPVIAPSVGNSQTLTFSGANAVTKSDSGTWFLSGVNTYSGATTVTAGKLIGIAGGSSANSDATVTSATLGVRVDDNTKRWTAKSVTTAGTSPKLSFGFSTTPSASTAPLNLTGNLTFTVTPGITLDPANLVSGQVYPLISVGGTAPTGTIPAVTIGQGLTGTASWSGNTLNVTVAGTAKLPLKWGLAGSGTWDINSTSNWKDATAALVKYLDLDTVIVGDPVVFDDTYASSDPTITLNTTVNPVSVTVNNSIRNYSISGTGAISGFTSLIKQGSKTLTLSTANSYSGATTVNNGTLLVNGSLSAASDVTVNSGASLGGSGTINGLLTVNATGSLTLGSSGSTLSLTSSTAPTFATSSTLKVAASSASLDKLSLTHATPTFACGNLNLVIDTTGLTGNYSGLEIVHTANAAGIIGTFASVTVTGNTSYYGYAIYSSNSITLILTKNLTQPGAYKIQVAGSSSATTTTGSNLALTVTAFDPGGAQLTALNGDLDLSFYGLASSPGNNAPVITDKSGTSRAVTVSAATSNTTLTFVNGIANVSGSNNGQITAFKAGTATLHCTDGLASSNSGASASGLSLTLNPLAIASYTVVASSPQVTGIAFPTTVTALDAYGNTMTTDSTTLVTMTSSGSTQFDSNGDSTFGDNTKTLTSGTFTINTRDNTPETITLTATSSGGKTGTSSSILVGASSAKDILTFTFPTYGAATISGTNITKTVPYDAVVTSMAPTYTVSPAATGSPVSGSARNFTTPQTYTITALDNSTKTYTVTVTIAPQPTTFNWATASGNWSSAANWTNNFSDGAGPAATGFATYTLNFNQSGTYTATNDLNNGFLLNQANFASTVTLAGTSGITFTNNGTTLPTVNQNSANTVNFDAPISLGANLTFGGSGAGGVKLNGIVSGAGKLIKSSSYRMDLLGANTYSGGTLISAGSVVLGSTSNSLLGTGTVTLNSGTSLSLNGNNNLTNTFDCNSATVSNGNSFPANLNGPVSLTGTNSIDLSTTGSMSIGGNIGGTGGFTKLGAGDSGHVLAITGANTFAGPVAINAGYLSIASYNSVSGGTANSNLGAPTTAPNGTISFGATSTGGSLTYTGNGETTDRVIKLAGTTGGATITQGGNAYLSTTRGQSGLLKFTSNVSTPGTASVDNRKTLTLTHAPKANTGGSAGQGEISGSIGDSLLGTSGQTATSITKAGVGTWTLSGSNSYTGSTKVQVGTLAITRSDALGTGPLDITTGAKLSLDFIGTRQVSAMTFDPGSAKPNGTYGSSASSATNKDDTRFSGLGTVTVGPLSSSPTVAIVRSSGSNPSSGGAAISFTATVTGNQPSGNVFFYDGVTLIGAGTLNGSYQATFTTTLLAGGSHTITAIYPGDTNNGAGYSNSLAQTVNDSRTATTTTLARTSGASPSAFGASLAFTATVSGASPTGNVAFYDDTTLLGTIALNGSSQATLTTSGLSVGYRPITASYLGNATNAPSTTATSLFQTVNPPAGNGKLKVFILAGQSNMQGKGVVEKGRDPNNYNNTNLVGGLGSLRNMLNKNPNRYGYLADSSSIANTSNTTVPGWKTLPNVWVSYFTSGATASATQARKGYLDADFGNGASSGQIGPEYGFGLVAGSQLSDPVLIIKTAWGGNSLAWNFRPPSSGTTTLTNINTMRDAYNFMVADVHSILNNLGTELSGFSYNPANGYEIVGFGWHQGYNDRISAGATAEYEANMTNLIKDFRTEFGVPNLPFVIGTTSMANVDSDSLGLQLVAAQKAVANPTLHPEFAGTVATIDTKQYDYGTDASPSTEGFHWNWNAESYFNIGEKMGQAMMNLLAAQSSAKDILTFTIPGQTASSISGSTISVTVPTGTDVTSLVPTFTISPLATATPLTGVARNFTAPQTYTITAQNLTTKTYTVTVTLSSSPYADWAANPTQGLTTGVNDGPLMDPDHDGINNLMEFALGGAPIVSSQAILPKLTKPGGTWVFEYDRSDLALPPATTQVVEYGNNLSGWTPITIPSTSAAAVTITPGTPSDHVSVTIPNLGNQTFVRLRVTVP